MSAQTFLIGLDYGSESARGVLIDAKSGAQVASHVHPYRHGIMTQALADGTALPPAWALQDAADYAEAAADILSRLGQGRHVTGIGLGFTASSPLPATAEGAPLSRLFPAEPHAFVKLWKHAAAQPFAAAINRAGGDFLAHFGGRVSGEWLLPKAAQLAAEAPALWQRTERFIEAGDWLVWQLTSQERRSLGLAAYKAQYDGRHGYPAHLVPGLAERLAPPWPVGTPAGGLSAEWRARTGILGPATVAVAVIDSHVVLPAVGGVGSGTLVSALGTSAVHLYLAETFKPLPPGIEGVARDGSIPGLWCYEAGQAGFGDMLAWLVRTFPRGPDLAASFAAYNAGAVLLRPGESHLVALDWWSGNRVPLADSTLSGVLAGLTLGTTAAGVYRALMEAACYGARRVVELLEAGGLAIERVILTSGLARENPLLVQLMADVLARPVAVPDIAHGTAVGAAIHGAVAGGLVADYAEGGRRFGARTSTSYAPDPAASAVYHDLYAGYRALAEDAIVQASLRALNPIAARASQPLATPPLPTGRDPL
ncbi:MAG: FGGY-family carbohydrate kinase [Geminicoccaceae bacterium]